ncbi:acriflavin resistance protein [Thermincola ferriacetica]|uniref:Acriflavin resistance protein n=1 Tax=Thermincola ferriacetica TaxID=281456 RepID=A0A0L6W4V0_9FIRM|nr:efflux RND transporter permease subunit [Thermincola ferriacetica]KNZ70403.1 acriflavin resistance protein [Thermincola ferriacetica]
MKVTELAIKKPVAMTMIIMFFVVLGLFSYTKLGADLFPKANMPFVTITSIYPGAGTEEMESQVVDPIEEQVSSISGLKKVASYINEGVATTVLEFTMSTDADVAVNDTQKAVDAVLIKLPRDMDKPLVQKVDLNAEPVITIAVSGERSLNEIYEIARDKIKDRLESVPGVATVNIVGGQEREILVEVDRNRLAAYGLSVNQVIQRLSLENHNVPSGKIKQTDRNYNIRLLGEFTELREIEDLLIPLPTGGTIPLKDIAKVSDTFKEMERLSRLNKKEAVAILVQKQSDASIVDTAEGIRKELESIKKDVPGDIKIVISDDTSTFITNSLADTKRTLVEGVVMTGIVLLFFLREWRSLVIVMLAIPTSIIATFMMMYFFGFTFNMLSLMGLSLCVGILVDDSIVVLENIHRHLQMGKNAEQAAIDGRGEIGMAAVAITLSDVVVFGPIAFMTGMVGQMFRQFGLTVVVATLFSLFVSFTLTPMLAAKFYKNHSGDKEEKRTNRLWAWVGVKTNALGHRVVSFYRSLLKWSLQHRLKVLLVVVAGIAASISLLFTGAIGGEFISNTDQSKFSIVLELTPGTPLQKTDQVVKEFEDRLAKIPEVESYFSMVGLGGGAVAPGNASHRAKIYVNLVAKNKRDKTVWQIVDEVRKWDNLFPGVEMKVAEAALPGMAYMEAPIIIELSGPDSDTLVRLAGQMKEITEKTPGTLEVKSSWEENGQPEIQVKVNREKAALYGLSAGEIAQALRAAMAGEVATQYREKGKEYDITVQLTDIDRNNVEELGNTTVTNYRGETVLLKQVADLSYGEGPTQIRHKNRQRMIAITCNYKGASLAEIRKSLDAGFAKLDLPPGFKIEYDGDIKQMDDSNADLIQALVLSLILVYMILTILYESFLTPFIRMLSLPCGIIGAMIALAITGTNLDMMSLIGIIMLDGLAAKNGTLLIDYTNTLMERGLSLRDALLEAGTTRLRPIFMTSVTMIFGMLPTALAFAEGSEIRKGMGIVLVGGLITSTILTPILIPVAYTLIDDFKNRFFKGRRKKEPVSAGA